MRVYIMIVICGMWFSFVLPSDLRYLYTLVTW
jgi:hypothetical protein